MQPPTLSQWLLLAVLLGLAALYIWMVVPRRTPAERAPWRRLNVGERGTLLDALTEREFPVEILDSRDSRYYVQVLGTDDMFWTDISHVFPNQ